MRRAAGSTVAHLVLSVGILMFAAGLLLPLLLETPDPPSMRVITIQDTDERKPAGKRRDHEKAERRRRQRRCVRPRQRGPRLRPPRLRHELPLRRTTMPETRQKEVTTTER